jgi:hypothetical protein
MTATSYLFSIFTSQLIFETRERKQRIGLSEYF